MLIGEVPFDAGSLDAATVLALLCAGGFFLNALLVGVWKYVEMARSEVGAAHPYVDIAHRASLLYSFAALLLAVFAHISALPEQTEFVASALVLAYFAMAIISYMVQGWRKKTDNQLRRASSPIHIFMWSLVIAEIGGFIVLFYGVIIAVT